MDLATSDPAVAAISRLEAMQTILEVLTESTGMRIALVARVTNSTWTACAVLDNASFGLGVGDDLPLETTY